MKRLLLLIYMMALTLPAYAAEDFKSTVSNLGASASKLNDDLDKIGTDPHRAVGLLVAELHVIPRRAYYEKDKTRESRHVIACLRALRFLTGSTFSAKTKAALSSDEKQFLDFKKEMHDENPDHKLHFFGVWMSRNAEFVAPQDVQKQIIEQWKNWQRQFGSSFDYKPKGKAEDTMENWFWFG